MKTESIIPDVCYQHRNYCNFVHDYYYTQTVVKNEKSEAKKNSNKIFVFLRKNDHLAADDSYRA